jgi:anti-sigma regulatory factor (Ser/Thr protein kinase)
MTEGVVHLSFPAKADYLLLARLALAGVARNVPLEAEALADLKLAVTEACGNSVRHAYPEGDGPVTVAYVTTPDRLELIVEDEGLGLDVSDLAELPDDFSDVRPVAGGMGMAIIRTIVDELEIGEGPGGRGTSVRMTKYLTA